ncbi:hypothetical protein Taro_032369, partial [Colocasia esculenta]|nr:hypothetical protein [Colocasia esculenta]
MVVMCVEMGRCLKCGSKDHQIKECPRLREFITRGVLAIATKNLATTAKENVLTEDDIDEVTTGDAGIPALEEDIARSDIEREEYFLCANVDWYNRTGIKRVVTEMAMVSHGKHSDRAREQAQRHMVRRFVRRLNPSLRVRLLESDPHTLDEALRAASRKESKVKSNHGEKPECVQCGKRHGRDVYLLKMGRCLKCGSKDHRIKECPRQREFVPQGVPATATKKLATPAKENGLIEDDIDEVTT